MEGSFEGSLYGCKLGIDDLVALKVAMKAVEKVALLVCGLADTLVESK